METIATSPKTQAETPKTADPNGKTLKKVSFKGYLPENSKDNGVGVSMNGKDEAFEQKIDSLEEGLEDSEMNGVCSLLKMQESESLKGLGSVLDFIDRNKRSGFGGGVDVIGSRAFESFVANEGCQDGNFGDVGYEGHEFSIGDFVWGKIRSHPWWPGRIYDHLDASDYAKKVKQRDKMLVAYFGDGTFAWCIPSQLKPFEEDFVEMSRQSSSKNFVNAVEEAMIEVGRLVDLKMTCSCVPKDNLIGFGRTLAVNAGIKEGLLVPENGIEKFSPSLFEPADFLPALKGIAQVAAFSNMLELFVLKNWLAAFYRARGGYQLPTYLEPQPVPGLDDDNRNWVVDLRDHSGGGEVTTQGPVEDWLCSPTGAILGQTTEGLLQKCQETSEDRHHHRRKQKSIAEILGGHTYAVAETKEGDVPNEETKLSKLAASAGRKTRKGGGRNMGQGTEAEDNNDVEILAKDGANSDKPVPSSVRKKRKGSDGPEGEKQSADVVKAGIISDKLASQFGRKRRKVSDEADAENKNKVGNVAKAGANLEKAASSSRGRKRKVSNESDVYDGNISKLRTRKETKLSESFLAVQNKSYGLEGDGSRVKNESRKSPLTGGRQEGISRAENNDGEGIEEAMRDDIFCAETEKGLMSRDRKKSKYLSPPYTNLNRGARKSEMEAESQMLSNEAQQEERLTKANGHSGSPLVAKHSEGEVHNKPSQGPGIEHQPYDNSGPQAPKQDENIDPTKVKASISKVLSEIRSAALNPTYLKRGNSLDMVEDFFSAFRSSVYRNGSNYKMYTKHQSGRKRKSKDSEPRPLVKDLEQTENGSTDRHKSRPAKVKSEESKSDKRKLKQDARSADTKINGEDSKRKVPAAALFVTFGPGSTLPAKNDLTKLYGKFGALNKEETNIIYDSRCARIVFFRSSDAEEAFNDSQLASPFGASNATFQLQYLSAETKTRELREISCSKPSLPKEVARTPDKQAVSKSSNIDVSQVKYIRQKLELMTSMLETSDGKISLGMKSKLEGEMKDLLEKVNTMVSSSS